MAGSFNRITLVGNLTRDPEIRYVGSGAAVTKFALAINTRSKQQEETMYVDIVAWDKLAETCNTYLKKGMSVLIDGRLSIRSYDTKEGEKRKSTEVVANTMQMLDSRGGARPDSDGGYERSAPPRSNGASSSNTMQMLDSRGGARPDSDGGYERSAPPRSNVASSSNTFADEDAALEDEIPF